MNLTADETAVRETLKFYSDGMETADADVLKKAFHDAAILCGYLGDEMIAAPIQGLYGWVEANPAPEAYRCTILDIEITGRVATAKVRETDLHGDFIDHFHLLKIGERWWVVSKLWDVIPAD